MQIAFVIIAVAIAILLLFLFLIFPAPRRHPAREVLNGRFIAHRGHHNINKKIPENSIAAFFAAVEQGYIIENDIHLTSDGEVVVFHDDTLKRMCGVDGKIEDKTLSELKKLRLGNTDENIPTLDECLEVVNGRVPLLIEFKVCGNSRALCEAADRILSKYKGEYFIQSFFPQVPMWYRKHRKDICRGQLATTFKGEAVYKRMLGCMLFNFLSRPDFVAYEHTYASHPMRRLVTKLGAFPVCWTLKNQKELKEGRKSFSTYIFENFRPH